MFDNIPTGTVDELYEYFEKARAYYFDQGLRRPRLDHARGPHGVTPAQNFGEPGTSGFDDTFPSSSAADLERLEELSERVADRNHVGPQPVNPPPRGVAGSNLSGQASENWTTLLSEHVRALVLQTSNPEKALEQFIADGICSATCVLAVARRIELGLDHNPATDMTEIREIIRVYEAIRKASIIAIAARDKGRAATINEALKELDAQPLSAEFKLEYGIKTASRSARTRKRASARQRRAP